MKHVVVFASLMTAGRVFSHPGHDVASAHLHVAGFPIDLTAVIVVIALCVCSARAVSIARERRH